MKPGIPWSVKGIDSEAREAAKHAARRSGMTLGEWLNTVIREQADEPEPQKKPLARNTVNDIQSKLDHLSEQLTRMARRDQDTAAGRYYEHSSRGTSAEQSLVDILARVEIHERQAAENFAQVGERLDMLGDKLAKGVSRFPQNPEDVPGYHSLETALRNIVDHIEVSERKTRDTLKSVQDRLSEVAYAATTGKEDELRKLVQTEFGRLAARIDSVKQASEAASQRAQAQAVQQAQKDLRDLESRMQNSLGNAQISGEIGHLRVEMESLGQRVDDLKAEAASEHDLRSLRVVIEQLSARVAQGPDLRPLADLDRRLTEITKWLEQGRGDHIGNQIADLEQRVFALDNRIAQAMRQDHAAQAWSGIEREFAGISGRLANTEQQLQHLATLEQSIHQLYQSMEQNRDWARDVAEDAADRMANRLMQDWPARPQAAGPSPELQALETALATVRANYETADQRNQETLGAVHETLEQIVNKLTDLEQLREQPQSSAEPEPSAAAAGMPPAEPSAETWPDLGMQADLETYRPLDPPSPPAPASAPAAVQDDFIAAARRAAQAAAQQTPGPSAAGFLGRQKASAAKAPSRFSLRFRKRKKPVTAASTTVSPPKPEDRSKRRRLILIGLVLLAAASALAYNNFIRKPAGPAPSTPPAVEQTKPSTGDSGMLGEINKTVASSLNTVLAKSDAIFGNGNFASSLPGGVKSTANEIAISDADALPAGIGSESLRQAALDGDPQAAFVVATRFAEGRSAPKDAAAAFRWYQIAAAKGLAPAQYRLGALLERGTGTAVDLENARMWYERAAVAGNVRAMHNAAVLHANGQKSKANYEQAARWFAEAAAHNLKDSQFNIALLYERGLGVGQDLGEALFWYSLAARQNDTDAAAKAKALANTLPKGVTAKIDARLAQWTPKPDLEKANVVAISNPDWQDRPVAAPASYDLPVIAAAVESAGADPVKEAQELLSRLGFDVGEINGAMGSRTRNSIRLFELQSGMRITGEVTPELLTKLRAKAG